MRKEVLKFLMLVFFFGACSKKESVEWLGDYDVPIQKDSLLLKYTYIRQPGSDTIINLYRFTTQLDSSHYEQTGYLNGRIQYQRLYKLINSRKELVKEDWYEYNNDISNDCQRLSAEIETYKGIKSGKQFEDLETEAIYTDLDGFRTSSKEEDKYVKDTILIWDNREVKSLKFNYELSNKRYIKYFPFFARESKSTGDFYYARGIGLFAFNFSYGEEEFRMNLIKIEIISKN